MEITCPVCGKKKEVTTGNYNRAVKIGAPLFCGKACSGIHRRKAQKGIEQKKLEKAEYDKDRRSRLSDRIKREKAEYFRRTYDPVKAAEDRKKRMPRHVEYCRREEYKKWKVEYDKRYRARTEYGEFAEAFLALMEVEKEIDSRMTRFEVYAVNERRSAQWRKRQLTSRHQT